MPETSSFLSQSLIHVATMLVVTDVERPVAFYRDPDGSLIELEQP